jgi:protein TonB
MRWAGSASVSLHLGVIAGAWLFMQSPPEDPSAAEAAVSVTIVAMDEATIEPAEPASEATASLVSSGMTQAAAEPLETEPIGPVEPQPVVTPSEAPILERLDQAAKLIDLQEITSASTSPLTSADPLDSPEPVLVANLNTTPEPVAEEVVEAPPVPAPRIVRKPVEAEQKPVEDKKPVEKKKAEKPVEKPTEKKKTKQVARLGNGGEAEADSAAKAAGGKQGKVSSDGGSSAAYAGKVRAKVIKALKRPSGSYDPGEARVSFTIDASGRLTGVRLSGSSGDAKVDKAVLAAVERAAPYPSFGEGAPRSFTFPLMIQ